MRKSRGRSQFPWMIVVLFIGLFLVALVVVMLTREPELQPSRSAPQPVYDRVVQALERNDAQRLYQELSPSLRDLFDYDALLQGQTVAGQIVEVKALVPVTVKNDPPWNGEWAEGQIRIRRGGEQPQTYLVRFHKEEGAWWLLGTLLLGP